jgi:hypothetical protein
MTVVSDTSELVPSELSATRGELGRIAVRTCLTPETKENRWM